MDCTTCKMNNKNKAVFGADVDKARLTRIIRYIVIAFCVTVVAFVTALAVIVVTLNNRWAATVEQNNAKWVECLSEFDVVEYSYDQDGNGVNIIGDENGVNYNVSEIESESQNP